MSVVCHSICFCLFDLFSSLQYHQYQADNWACPKLSHATMAESSPAQPTHSGGPKRFCHDRAMIHEESPRRNEKEERTRVSINKAGTCDSVSDLLSSCDLVTEMRPSRSVPSFVWFSTGIPNGNHVFASRILGIL